MANEKRGEWLKTSGDATKLSAYELARRWADREGDQSREGDLEELVVMAALREWLTRWLPLQVHRAALSGSRLDEITEAVSQSAETVRAMWEPWVAGQRELYDRCVQEGTYRIGVSEAEHNQVRYVLEPGELPRSSEAS